MAGENRFGVFEPVGRDAFREKRILFIEREIGLPAQKGRRKWQK
jgi:hypothetical protein